MNLLLLKDRRLDKSLRNIPHWMLVPPVALLLLSTLPTVLVCFLVRSWLDIPMNKLTKNSPHAMLFLAGFLAMMVVFCCIGYVLGFVVDALLLRFVCHWPWAKIKDLMLHSKLPPEWTVLPPVRD